MVRITDIILTTVRFTVSLNHHWWIICILSVSMNHWVKIAMVSHLFRACMTGLKLFPKIRQWVVGVKNLTGQELNVQALSEWGQTKFLQKTTRPLSYTLRPLPKSNINLVYYTSLDLTFWSLKYGLWMIASSFMKYNQYLESFVCLWAAWEIAIKDPEKKMGEDMNWGKGTDKARRKTDRLAARSLNGEKDSSQEQGKQPLHKAKHLRWLKITLALNNWKEE